MQNALMSLAKPALAEQYRTGKLPSYPDDSNEWVFLLRACEKIGAAFYGSEWTGKERTTVIPELLPDALDPAFGRAMLLADPDENAKLPAQWYDQPSRAVLVRANDLLARRHPERSRFAYSGLIGAMVPIVFTYAEWREAQAEARTDYDAAMSARIRWLEVQQIVKKHCESGELRTYLRKVEGGDYSQALPRSWWRTENYFVRFITFMMHPVHPFVIDLPAVEYQWIFVDAGALERIVVKLGRKAGNLDSPTGVYESEYMQCMRDVSAALKISVDNMPKKVSVEHEIPNHWRGPGTLSDRQVKAMASFIRSAASGSKGKHE